MKSQAALNSESAGSRKNFFLGAAALASGAGFALLAAHPVVFLAAAAAIALALFALKSIREPLVLVTAFLLAVILLPPFYTGALGETPVYASTLLVPIGLAIILVRLPDFHLRFDPIAQGLLVFTLGTGLSLPFGWWLSGMQVGNQSFFRWLMLAQVALIYFLIRGGARRQDGRFEKALISILLVAAVLTAAYGIVDFIWPIPIPHPAADQFIWMRTSILRRAQGVFYEAGNFANLCAFFLVLAASALVSGRERELRIPLPLLWAFTGTLGLAVVVSFTRSAWISVLVAMIAFVCISREVKFRRLALLLSALGLPVLLLPLWSRSLWDYLLNARLGNLAQLFADPNLASSGRFDTWNTVLSIAASHPQFLLLGIGYKTLPYTRLFHHPLITDNGFLNLILECGVVGLGGFLFFSAAIFRTCLRAARERTGVAAFWGAVLFAFWCGEWAQMMAVDAYTYWRNLAVFGASMAFLMNRFEREGLEAKNPPQE
ncbi:MAG TPA: O-antigen ligase family protein [Terriglobia bacterium]|nr:O-antigen ligase family protein [Terriglobia bacterium]